MSASTAVHDISTTAIPSSASATMSAFWERLWRSSGIQLAGLFVVTCIIYGHQPQVAASPDALVSIYSGDRTRILVAAIFAGLNILNLLWFAAALRTALTEAGQDGWGAAATASSATFAGMYLLFLAIVAALSFSVAGSGNIALTSGLNDFAWALVVLSSFPRAMLIMSGTFGLWRAGLISNPVFAIGVAAVVLGVLGGTTWAQGGFWAPDGTYSRLVFPIVGLVWIVGVSRVLLTQKPSPRSAW